MSKKIEAQPAPATRINSVPVTKARTGYRFMQGDKSPELYHLLWLKEKLGWSWLDLHKATGITMGTFKKWDEGKTLNPQASSIRICLKAMGVHRRYFDKDGNIIEIPGEDAYW